MTSTAFFLRATTLYNDSSAASSIQSALHAPLVLPQYEFRRPSRETFVLLHWIAAYSHKHDITRDSNGEHRGLGTAVVLPVAEAMIGMVLEPRTPTWNS